MKKNIAYILVFTLLIAIGCEDTFLDTVPTDSISEAAAFDSPENMLLVLNGLHRQMFAQSPLDDYDNYSRSGESHFIPSFDAVGGSIIHSSPGNGWMRPDLQWNMHTISTSTTVTQLWYQRYHYIASTNAIINNAEAGGFPLDAQMNDVLGQAHAYRAWSYWRLVTTYAKGYLIGNPQSDLGVPILLSEGAPYDSGPRATVAEVYDQIEADIDAAIEYLKNASTHTGANAKSHISLNAAYGIKARVALSKGDWQVAATNAALARDGYPLLGEEDWLSGFNSLQLDEVIWGGHVIDSETNYFAAYFYYISPTFNGSQNRSNPKIISKELYDRLPATDYRTKAWLPLAPNTNSSASNGQGGGFESDPNYDNDSTFWAAWENVIDTFGMTTGHNTHPYMTVKFLQANPGGIDPDDVIYMRSSEMVLIEAEAYAMLGQYGNARTALNLIGQARDSAFDAATIADGDLMDEIKFQRRIELWGEGFSYHDQIRWDEGLDQTNSGAAQALYQDGFIQAKPSQNDEWIWKIPQSEVDANPNISENEQN